MLNDANPSSGKTMMSAFCIIFYFRYKQLYKQLLTIIYYFWRIDFRDKTNTMEKYQLNYSKISIIHYTFKSELLSGLFIQIFFLIKFKIIEFVKVFFINLSNGHSIIFIKLATNEMRSTYIYLYYMLFRSILVNRIIYYYLFYYYKLILIFNN